MIPFAALLGLIFCVAPGLAGPAPLAGTLELVESTPIGAGLDDPAMRDAHDVWVEMITSASASVDVAQFYVSPKPGGRLDPALTALKDAASRGVQVRFLADAKFAKTYPDTLQELSDTPGITLRRLDLKPTSGGVLHAKYFLVDGKLGFIGSQNFDWRSLTHNQELGVRFDDAQLGRQLAGLFNRDWALAGGEAPPTPLTADPLPAPVTYRGLPATASLFASPETLLDDPATWDLPELLAMINGSTTHVRVQVMSHTVREWDGSDWDTLDAALRAAAGRGVTVQVLVADWSKKKRTVDAAKGLAAVDHVEVRFFTVPQHPSGFIPFARVIHAKYMTVDGHRSWLGTSNWSRDYFESSRNVGLVVEGPAFTADLDQWFDRLWNSPNAEVVDPNGSYTPPRTK